MSSTDLRTRASWMASEHEVVVFPTPPFPPTKIQRRVFWEMMLWRVGSRGSSESMVVLVAMVGFCGRRGGGEIVSEATSNRISGNRFPMT